MTAMTRPQPFSSASRLSRTGLTIALLVMIGTPVVLVAASIALFPSVDEKELAVLVTTEGYHEPAEVQASVDAFRQGKGEVLEPYITVHNQGDESLSSLFVTVNKRFVFHAAEPLAAGEKMDIYLSRMLEPDGSMFWPHKYDMRRIIVKARLPSKKQAIYQAEWSEVLDREQAELTGAEQPASTNEVSPVSNSNGVSEEELNTPPQ